MGGAGIGGIGVGMQRSHRQLVADFFTALSAGALTDDLFTDDMTVWTTTSGIAPKAKYQGGVQIFKSLFREGPQYIVDTLTMEEDRAAAEVHATGTLINGEHYQATYVFIINIRDSRIAKVAEHCNPLVVRDKIMPLMAAKMGK
jgi:ketosteroid isomerase-like protein